MKHIGPKLETPAVDLSGTDLQTTLNAKVSGNVPTITVAATAPVSPQPNDIWIDIS
jgi:hypothetical protein